MQEFMYPILQAKHVLLEEIREINQQLIDTVVVISDEDTIPTAAATEGGQGTIVKCSFSAVAISPNFKSQQVSAQMVVSKHSIRLLFINYMHYLSTPCIDFVFYGYAVANSAIKIACSHKLSKYFSHTPR
jgi:N-acetylglutamate synthase-like GNAT family acetyltransferase